MKSSQSFAGSYGVYGLDLPLCVRALLSEKLGISSTYLIGAEAHGSPHNHSSAFKYCCRARGEKLEKSKLTYACLATVVRDGGFKIALIARLSAIPGHCTSCLAALPAIIN